MEHLQLILPQESLVGKLVVSLWMDLMGSASYLLPVVGEGFDVAWAPIQTIMIMAMYDHVAPNLKYLSFVEEILPLTDIVPSATIGWLAEFGVPWAEAKLGIKLPKDSGGNEEEIITFGRGPYMMNASSTSPSNSSNPNTPFTTPLTGQR